jgi:ribonuclease R
VTGFGVFVVVDDPFVEGLVRIDALSDDYYTYDETACRLVGRRSGRAFALGDAVKIEVQSVSVVRRKIDFALHEHQTRQRERAARGHATGKDRGRRRERDRDRAGREKQPDRKEKGKGKEKSKRGGGNQSRRKSKHRR